MTANCTDGITSREAVEQLFKQEIARIAACIKSLEPEIERSRKLGREYEHVALTRKFVEALEEQVAELQRIISP